MDWSVWRSACIGRRISAPPLVTLGVCSWAIKCPPPTMPNSPPQANGSEEGLLLSKMPVIFQVFLRSGHWKVIQTAKTGVAMRGQNGWPSGKRSAFFRLKRLGCIDCGYPARRNCFTLARAWCAPGFWHICWKGGQPAHRQSTFFAGPLECSWVVASSWLPHHRLELENDVIAAPVLSTGTIPQAQFLG